MYGRFDCFLINDVLSFCEGVEYFVCWEDCCLLRVYGFVEFFSFCIMDFVNIGVVVSVFVIMYFEVIYWKMSFYMVEIF